MTRIKKISALLMLTVALTFGAFSVHDDTSTEIQVVLDGDVLEFDVPPMIIDGRVMVPVRAIFEALGMEVEWNLWDMPDGIDRWQVRSQTWGDTGYSAAIWMFIGEYILHIGVVMTIGDSLHQERFEYELDAPPMIVYDRTLVPMMAISKIFGVDARWCGETKTITIETSEQWHRHWSE